MGFSVGFSVGVGRHHRACSHEVVLVVVLELVVVLVDPAGGWPRVPASARVARSVPRMTMTSAPASVDTGGVAPADLMTEGPRLSASATSSAMVVVPLFTT